MSGSSALPFACQLCLYSLRYLCRLKQDTYALGGAVWKFSQRDWEARGELSLLLHHKHHVFWRQTQSMACTVTGQRVWLCSHRRMPTKLCGVAHIPSRNMYTSIFAFTADRVLDSVGFENLGNDFKKELKMLNNLRNEIYENSEREESQWHLNTPS